MANLTLSVDEAVVERAREVARQQGTSLNALIREYLEQLAGVRAAAQVVADLDRAWAAGSGHSGGRTLTRDDAYEGRLG